MAPLTAADAGARWLTEHAASARTPRFYTTTRQRLADFWGRYFGARPLADLRPADMLLYRAWLLQQPARAFDGRPLGRTLSVASVRSILSDAACLLRWAEDVGLLERAPLPRRFLPRVPVAAPDRLSETEMAAVAACPGVLGRACRLGLATGLRWGELTRVIAADFDGECLTVRKAKGGTWRRVPVAGWFRPELAALCAGRVGRIIEYASGPSFNKMVRRHAGLPHFHVHQLRHTFACTWLARGGSLAALQEILGHSSITVTQRYARLGEDLVRREAARILALPLVPHLEAADAAQEGGEMS